MQIHFFLQALFSRDASSFYIGECHGGERDRILVQKVNGEAVYISKKHGQTSVLTFPFFSTQYLASDPTTFCRYMKCRVGFTKPTFSSSNLA